MTEQELIKKIEDIPTLPTIYQKLLAVLEDPHSTSADIAKVISLDQATALKVLRIANSPIFRLTGRIDSIRQAVMQLGLIEIRNIVLALSVINVLKMDTLFPYLKTSDFWKHSIAVGAASKIIADAVSPSESDNAFLGGILHDVGKLVLMIYFTEEYQKVFENYNPGEKTVSQVEKEILGFDHAYIGGVLAEYWSQSKNIVNIISYHNVGMIDGVLDKSVAIVHLGDIYARSLSLGYPGDDLIPEPNHKIWEIINVPENFFTKNADNLRLSYSSLTSMIL